MSDVEKMYQAPDQLGEIQTPTEGTAGVSADTRLFIGQAAPWLKFIGVMGFIGCGFMVLSGITMMAIPGALSGMKNLSSGLTSGIGILVGVLYLALSVFMFFPARFTFKMGTAAGAYKMAGQAHALEELASNLKKWAKFNGIICIVGIGLGVVGFIGAIIFGIVAATSRGL
jgi:hypothetical protein